MTDEVTAKAMGGGKDIHLAPRSAERTQGEDFEQSPNYDANYWTPDSTGLDETTEGTQYSRNGIDAFVQSRFLH
jgi:hypothetical protein